jgi:hypothetical protein
MASELAVSWTCSRAETEVPTPLEPSLKFKTATESGGGGVSCASEEAGRIQEAASANRAGRIFGIMLI